MSLELKFLVTPNLLSYSIQDLTGEYDALNNPGGYGNVNPTRATITSSSLTITNPDSTATTIDLFTQDFPNLFSIIELNNESGLVFADGVYDFAFTVSADSNDYTVNYKVLQINNLKCLVAKLALGNKIKDFTTFKLLYDRISYAFSCGNYTLVSDILIEVSRLQSLCNIYPCNCGC